MKFKKINTLLFLGLVALVSSCTKSSLVQNPGSSGSTLKGSNFSGSMEGDVVGKVTVGYQGWFAAAGDGSPINGWWHWAKDWSKTPSISDTSVIKSWPDVRDYTTTFTTNYPNLENGQPAKLFSSFSTQTVNTQFQWMQQYGIDVAALQRFNPTGGEGPIRDAMALKVKNAAETYGRKFYIMYDVSGWTNMQSEIKTDWINKMSAYTSSPAYAKQNGKFVVCIWGFGFKDGNHPWSAEVCKEVIQWFKNQGYYVIGGVPTHWRLEESTADSKSGFLDTYSTFDMLSPWMVGRIGNLADVDNHYNNYLIPDKAYCDAHGIDYQPCVLPGDLQERQRRHGDFMWRQFYNLKRANIPSTYVSMFDEYNEGNQIAKTAETKSFVPANSNILALDEDGVKCSADYYLRLTNDGGKMLKGLIPLTANRPTEPIIGGGTIISPPIGQVITIKGSNNLYVSSENALKAMNCNRPSAGGWEQFNVVNAGGNKVALQNLGKYVSSEGGNGVINCNRAAIGIWEQFDWINNADGTVSFRSNLGNYISINKTTGVMTCTKPTAGADESFVIN